MDGVGGGERGEGVKARPHSHVCFCLHQPHTTPTPPQKKPGLVLLGAPFGAYQFAARLVSFCVFSSGAGACGGLPAAGPGAGRGHLQRRAHSLRASPVSRWNVT